MLRADGVEIRWFFSFIRRWLWLIVGCMLLGAASAFLVSSRRPPVYNASATLLVQVAPDARTSEYNAILASELLARTYSRMLKVRPVMEAVIVQLELQEPPDTLAERINVKLVPNTQLIQLSVTHSDPAQAAQIANTIAETFIAHNLSRRAARYVESLANVQEQITELSALIEETRAAIDALDTSRTVQEQSEWVRLESILAGYRNTYATLSQNYEQMRLTVAQSTDDVVVVETAQVPRRPVQRRLLVTTLAGIAGAMLAVGVAVLVEYLDDTVKTPDDVSRTLDLNTLGTIGQLKKGGDELIVAAQPFSPVAEAFRILRTNIRFSGVDSPLRSILVTSPSPTEGKSIAVANLAATMAQAGLRVVALDADLRRPRLHQLFGLQSTPEGLTRALLEGNTDGRLKPAPVEGLMILTSGELPPNPADMLGSHCMQELLQKLTDQADVVLVDGPPVLPLADAALLAPSVDGVLLVLYAGKTRREDARRAVESLHQVGANLVGVVLNAMPNHKGAYYEYYEIESRRVHSRPDRWRGYLTAARRLLW